MKTIVANALNDFTNAQTVQQKNEIAFKLLCDGTKLQPAGYRPLVIPYTERVANAKAVIAVELSALHQGNGNGMHHSYSGMSTPANNLNSMIQNVDASRVAANLQNPTSQNSHRLVNGMPFGLHV